MEQFGDNNSAPEIAESHSGQKKIIIGLVVIVVIMAGLWYLNQGTFPLGDGGFSINNILTRDDIDLSDDDLGTVIPLNTGEEPTEEDMANPNFSETLIKYTNDGFEPGDVTISPGETVTFVNSSDGGMWVASDDHPTHTILPAFDQKESVGNGETYSFTFNSSGEWTYHNHVNSGAGGLIFVR